MKIKVTDYITLEVPLFTLFFRARQWRTLKEELRASLGSLVEKYMREAALALQDAAVFGTGFISCERGRFKRIPPDSVYVKNLMQEGEQ